MKISTLLLASLFALHILSSAHAADALFSQDFSEVKEGEPPDGFLVLDGQFAVKHAAGDKFLELPGAPLESYGVLFGPNEAAGIEVEARIRGTRTGRKFPTFAAGVNGGGGYKIRVVPAKNAVELVFGLEDVRASAPFKWTSGEWTHLKIRITKTDAGVAISAKAWQTGAEPADWTLTTTDKEAPPAGKPGVWGMPFSGTPIQFDDLKVSAIPAA
jgi:hypothetical protein